MCSLESVQNWRSIGLSAYSIHCHCRCCCCCCRRRRRCCYFVYWYIILSWLFFSLFLSVRMYECTIDGAQFNVWFLIGVLVIFFFSIFFVRLNVIVFIFYFPYDYYFFKFQLNFYQCVAHTLNTYTHVHTFLSHRRIERNRET